MPDYTFLKINIWYAINTQALDVDYQCKTFGKTKNLHIVSEFWPLKVLTTTYCVICMSSFESCLCLKAPREFLRVKPLQWVVKTIDLPRFLADFWIWELTFSRNVLSGINKGFRWQYHWDFQPGHGDAIRQEYEGYRWKGMVLSGINWWVFIAIWVISGINIWIPVARWLCHQE